MKDGTFQIFDDMIIQNFTDPEGGWSTTLMVPKGAKTVTFRSRVSGSPQVLGKSLLCATRTILDSGPPSRWTDLKSVGAVEVTPGAQGSKEWTPRKEPPTKPIPIAELGLIDGELHELEFVPEGEGAVLRAVQISFDD